MSISFIAPVAAGNAVQILLSPPDGALQWRLLRKDADTIASADDADAVLVMQGDDKFTIDSAGIANGTEYFYRAFYLIDDSWVASPSRSVTPAAQFADLSTDVIDIVRDRIDLGFAVYHLRGDFPHDGGHVPVLLATPAFEDAPFPLLTVHLASKAPAERFIGEIMGGDVLYADDEEIGSSEGWLSRYQIQIIGWCLNGDVRADMRKILSAVVIANLPVFESSGMSLVEATFADQDDMSTYQVPMYQATCMLSCIARDSVEGRSSIVNHVVAGTGPIPLDELEDTSGWLG